MEKYKEFFELQKNFLMIRKNSNSPDYKCDDIWKRILESAQICLVTKAGFAHSGFEISKKEIQILKCNDIK